MAKLNFSVSLDDDEIPNRVRKSLKGGMRDAGDRLLDAGEKTAKNTIQKRGRVWRRELMRSFKRENEGTGKGRRAVLRNVATHAGPVEHGAVYGARGPPIAALIPWILSKWNPGSGDAGESGGGGSFGGASKNSTTRSKQFSHKQKLRSPSSTKNYRRISDEVWTELDTTNLTDNDQLQFSEAEILQMQLEMHPELNEDAVGRVAGDILSWKVDSSPSSDRVARYAMNTKTAFGIDGKPRGRYSGTLTQDDIDVLRTINELSRTHLRDNVAGGEDSLTLHRGLTRETGRLAKEIVDNPSAESWEIDVNVINNYTTMRRKTDMFDRGFVVTRQADIDDEITTAPDFILPTRNRGELEIHLRGGDRTRFNRDELFFVIYPEDQGGEFFGKDYVPIGDILTKMESGSFADFGDDELLAFNRLVRQMHKYDVKIETPAGQRRIEAFKNEFINRDLTQKLHSTEQEFVNKVNSVIS